MQNLRDAAQRFAAEMAMKAEKNGDQTPQELNRQVQSLDKLMDRLEEAARNGAREEAEAMLDQMQNMFENMQSAENGEESAAERDLRKQIDELGKLMRDQQALRDDTFRSDQRDEDAPAQAGAPAPRDGAQDARRWAGGSRPGRQGPAIRAGRRRDGKTLGDRQKELSDRLAEMQRMLKSLGMKGEKGFDAAEGDMKEAEGDLKGEQGRSGDAPGRGRPGRSNKGAAVDAQGRALEALREGAQGLQQQMNGQGQGGQGRYQARRMRPGEQQGDDPLGRGREQAIWAGRRPLREMGSVAERARRVMERAPPPPRRSQPPGRGARLSRTADEAGLSLVRPEPCAAFQSPAVVNLSPVATPEEEGRHSRRAVRGRLRPALQGESVLRPPAP